MEVPSRTDVKRIVKELTKDDFNRMDLELIYLRKMVRKLEEEIVCLKDFKYKGGKNII